MIIGTIMAVFMLVVARHYNTTITAVVLFTMGMVKVIVIL